MPGPKVFDVRMLAVLREPFEDWMRDRGLVMFHVPGSAPNSYVVIIDPDGPLDRLVNERVVG